MPSSERQLHLGINVLADGAFPGAWRAPEADPLGPLTLKHWTQIAQTAEAAKLDAIFLADTLALRDPEGGPWEIFDPGILQATMAAKTELIGLVPTISTSFEEPFNLARRIATLDHLSNGRAGWNVVTSLDSNAARNFSARPHLEKRARYARAGEFVDVVCELWDSWQDDALVADKERGVWADSQRIHAIEHHGQHFDVTGPLNLPRSPQGRPVLVQAGGSPEGLDLAARYAEAVFVARADLPSAITFRADLRERVRAYGRDPDSILVLPGLVFTIGGTEAEAYARREELEQRAGERVLGMVAGLIGIDPGDLEIDGYLPESLLHPAPGTAPADLSQGFGSQGFRDMMLDLARSEPLTVRQLSRRAMIHRNVIGTPEQVADSIEEWFRAGASDGFNLMPDIAQSGLADFAEHVVPILQRRGIFRTDYVGTTLRDHLGLARPAVRLMREASGPFGKSAQVRVPETRIH